MMASQDDLGMLWYGVTGVSFNPTDPADVMLNTGSAAPLLSDHPRPLMPTPMYGEPNNSQPQQMLYDPNTGDYVSHQEYMYEYEGYDEDSSGGNSVIPGAQHESQSMNEGGHTSEHHQPDESPPPLPKSKKPKVHHHPALKLKTPIAYQKDTDLNAIPIMREGMAVCEKCGAIGVKHAFYGKERKYCSLACARGPLPPSQMPGSLAVQVHNQEHQPEQEMKILTSGKLGEPAGAPSITAHEQAGPGQMTPSSGGEMSTAFNIGQYQHPVPNYSQSEAPAVQQAMSPQPYPLQMPPQLSPQVPQPALHNTMNNPTNFPPAQPSSASYFTSDELTTVDLDGTFYWDTYLYDENFTAVPVSSFKHAPMSECWEQMSPGMKVEVACGDEGISKDAYWVATVISVAGYKAKLRFEGFVDDDSKDFWVSLCGEGVHPVGWCATQGRPLIPPKSIQHKYKDWKEFLMRRLTGARTLPTNFMSRVAESHKSRFRPGLDVEVVDKNRIAQMRVATVTEVVGKRLHLRYHGAPQDDNGFWCHEDAPIIHPVGWSREVGHEIVASQSYHEKCITGTYDANDAVPSLFLTPPVPAYARNSKMGFTDGMKLEAIDPLNLSSICVATVMKALHNNYLMIRIDSYESDNTCSDWFCYHSTSPCIFPAGFCEMNGINLTPPRGYDGTFSWYAYLNKTKATAAPPALFNREVPQHGYAEGMALESADLMDPRLVCVANIKQVNGRLLKVHFDGWETDFDQWIDCYSSDIYPVGWCEMVGYRLEGPKVDVPTTLLSKKKFKGTKGKRGRPVGTKKIGNSRIATSQNTMLSGASTGMPGRRGRPPKYRTDSRQQDNVTQDANITQDIPPPLYTSVGSRRGRGGGGRGRDDNRRSPRSGSSISISKQESSRATNRVTNTPQSYSQSDEEEDDPMNDMDHNMSGDETSSGVASLAGSESSREPWDMMDESSQNMINPTPPASPHQTSNLKTTNMMALNTGQIQEIQEETKMEQEEYIETSHETFNTTSCSKLSESNIRYENSPMSTTMQLAASQSSGSINEWQQQQQYNIGVSTAQELSVNGVKADALVTAASQSSAISSTLLQQEEVKQENTIADEPVIPRLLDGPVRGTAAGKVQPKLWTPDDVATFLTKNDCGQYCHNFVEQKITGSKLLSLSQNDVMGLTGMKVGPSLKIHDLVQQLLALVSPAQARYQATLMKRGLSFS